MKKTIYLFGMAALALAFTACNKKEEDTSNRAEEIHYATITLGKDVDTKTSVVEGDGIASYRWCDDDDQYLNIYENGAKGEIQSFTLNADKTQATLVVSFTGGSAPYTYEAKYAKELSSSKNPKVQANQYPTATSFDPAADIMVSQVKEAGNTRLTNLSFKMGRVITVNKMTLTGLEEGEVISKVEFTLDKSVWGFISPDSDGGYKVTNGGNKLTLNYENDTNPVGLVPSDGKFPVYFVSAPVENAAITSVVVTTDRNVYTKAGNADGEPFYGRSINFAVGTMTRFNMDMANYGSPIEDEIPYNKVEDDAMIRAGAEYLFVGPKSDTEICAAGAYDTSYYSAVDVTDTDNVIFIQGEQVMVFTLEAGENEGQFYIQDSEGYYLYWSSGNSVARNKTKGDKAYLWTINLEDGIVNVKTDERVLQYNATSPRFACYKGTQKAITLYVNEATLVELADPELEFEGVTDDPIEVAWADKDSFVPPTLSNPYELSITWTSEDEDVATVDANGAITLKGNGTTTITATSEKTSEFYAGSASYKLTVSGKPGNPGTTEETALTVSEALEVIADMENNGVTADSVYVHGIISEVISFNSTYNSINYNITADGSTSSDALYVYSGKGLNGANFTSINDLTVGDEVVIKGKLKKYVSNNTTTPEFTSNSKICSIIKAPFFNANLSANTIGHAGGDLTLTISANTTWTVSINGGATLQIPTAGASASVSGNTNAEVTVHIPANTTATEVTYTITMNPTGVTAPEALTITQSAHGEDPKGSEANPYTVAEALVEINKLANNGSSETEVYVSAVVANVISYNSTYKSLTYNIKDADGSESIKVYSGKGLNGADFTSTADLNAGDIVVVKGKLLKYIQSNVVVPEIDKNSQITSYTPATRYNITLANVSNGTISASATSASAGTEITLTATPDNGYRFASWTVTDASGNDITVTNDKFTMPASDVTVSAAFELIPSGSKTYTIQWGSNYNSKGVSSYTAAWSVTKDGLTCDMANWNNNNNGWNFVKAGSKNDASVATITTASAIPEAIQTVKITIDAVTADKINSLKLYVSSSSSFDTKDEYSFTVATGEQSVTISAPTANKYYQIEADCSKGSANGLITVSKLVFTTD